MTALAPLPSSALRLFDDFNLPTLDPAVWSVKVDKTAERRSGIQFVDDPRTVHIADGCLELAAVKTPQGWLGGEVITLGKLDLLYGRVEVKAQLPACQVSGLQQTFWLWPVNSLRYGPWPLSGEVDFAEFYSLYPALVVPYIHAPNNDTTTKPVDPQQGFHRYQVDWRPGAIQIAVDDQVILTYPGGRPFDQPFFLVLTQTVGVASNRNAPTAQTPSTATTRVDWVKVWH